MGGFLSNRSDLTNIQRDVCYRYGGIMKRTQIYLPAPLHKELREEARKHNTTLSEVIRQRIARGNSDSIRQANRHETFRELDKVSKKLNWQDIEKNLSEKIDETLYE